MTTTAPFLSAEDLAAITADVWAAFLLADDARLLPAYAELPRTDLVHALVEVTGAWTGRVTLEVSAEGAELATRTMLRTPQGSAVVEADLVDAVGELANMVGGNVKSLGPAPSALGLPVVARGAAPKPGEVECVAELAWQGNGVRVVVSR